MMRLCARAIISVLALPFGFMALAAMLVILWRRPDNGEIGDGPP